MRDKKLDFVVIGAQKCATSWMYYCLNDHPQLGLPEKKQEAAYIGGEMYQKNGGEDWFFARYSTREAESIRGDVSVDYLYQSKAVDDIEPFIDPEGVRFIASLRDPVERMISSYFWLVRRGVLPDLPLEKGIQPILEQPIGFPNPIEGPLEEIVRRGCYAEQLLRYTDKYGCSSVFPVLYENISKDGLKSIQAIYRSLGVKSDFSPPSIGVKPKKNTYNRLFLKFERMFNNKIGAKISNYANQAVAKVVESKPQLSDEARSRLVELYTPEVRELQSLFATLPDDARRSVSNLNEVWNEYK